MSNQLELFVFFENTKKDAVKNHDACLRLEKRASLMGKSSSTLEHRYDDGITFLDTDFFRRITKMPKFDS